MSQTTTTHKVYIVNAFVDHGEGGNPAGVFLDADGLSTEDKQRIAAQVGLSETAFVSSSKIADFKLDFFTPTRQIAHCGHATIATFSLLAQLGRIARPHTSKETIEGPRQIIMEGDTAFMEQLAPNYEDLSPDMATLLEEALGQPVKATVVSTGNRFAIVPFAQEAELAALSPDMELLSKISEALNLIGVYAFVKKSGGEGRAATTRMFAPYYGISEEAATGMAAGPLACYLRDKEGLLANPLFIEQGHFMTPASPSLLEARFSLAGDRISALMVGGKAKTMRELTLGND